MIALCSQAGLPEPDFEQRGNQFVVTIWWDWLTDKVMDDLRLNERQIQAIAFVKANGRITNADYQRVTGASRKTASRDLDELMNKKILSRRGAKRGTHYILVRK